MQTKNIIEKLTINTWRQPCSVIGCKPMTSSLTFHYVADVVIVTTVGSTYSCVWCKRVERLSERTKPAEMVVLSTVTLLLPHLFAQFLQQHVRIKYVCHYLIITNICPWCLLVPCNFTPLYQKSKYKVYVKFSALA